ncbi:MAG TPA: sigma-70 family RNA polymerase sigma factor [Clostridiales bacterium]|nr:sigma-70 family RNA polymerase sigma factor [Clostridiales bacterium]HQP71011.1 sigma-70 family RNA polymerase sigma factor [Clostridiales bacterium]
MIELEKMVIAAKNGDLKAYEKIIESFKSMAVGYSFSILKDRDNAEDAVQESFIEAYYNLGSLKQPAAFPGWFKKIVFKQCDRIKRKPENRNFEPIDDTDRLVCQDLSPDRKLEKSELKNKIGSLIEELTEDQKITLNLFYIKDYSVRDISEFLEITEATVKKRLYDARQILKERMTKMVKETVPGLVPDEIFSKKIINELLKRPKALTGEQNPVKKIYDSIMEVMADFEFIHTDERIKKTQLRKLKKDSSKVYHVDDDKVLRDTTTESLLLELSKLQPPVKLCTAGRVFRPNKEDTTHSKVFNQYEIMEIGDGVTKETMQDRVEKIIKHTLSNIEMRFIEFKYPGYNCSYDFEVRKDEIWISVGGCGMMNIDLLKRHKIDSEIYSGYGIGLGLERLAMIKYGINNIDDLIEK